MDNKKFTGNQLLDKLIAGPYVKNPNYNPNTKAGRNQPMYLVDTTPGDINGGEYDRIVESDNRMSFTNRDLGLSYDEFKKYQDKGITVNPYISREELNKALAESQSAFNQFGNMLMQLGVGEIVLGTLEGFGNIYDGVVNSFTKDNYSRSAWTNFFNKQQEDLKEAFEIYQKDPDNAWAIGDFGWWAQNALSVGSTLSLILPAAGWAKAIGYAGKLSRANKLLQWSTKGVSRGIAKAVSKSPTTGKFEAIRSVASKSNRIQQSIESGARITTQAVLSRAGENYMEATEIYDTVYRDSKENLENMPNEEFNKLLELNPEFKDMSKDDIAKEIARQSATKTFSNDYWMLLMDIAQFKALGSLWGKGVKRHVTSGERIAAKNAKLRLAGVNEDKLIQNTFINRQKEHLQYALKNPKESFLALNLGEGFEEMYQGIQSEKGMEVATKYFNPAFTQRSLYSYMTDGHIWEQFFWGSLGAIVFNAGYNKVQHLDKKIKGLYNKKHMSAEDYERWKLTEDKIATSQINSLTENVKQFVSDMETISEGKNPYKYTIDKSTGRKIIKDGKLQNETIDEIEQDLLKQEAIKNFVDVSTINAVDVGIDELMAEILDSNEFDQYIEKNGLQLSSADKKLSKQIADRMRDVAATYKLTLDDVNNSADTTNPYITRAVARNITAYKLMSGRYSDELLNIDARINEANDTNADISKYENNEINKAIQRQINFIERKLNAYKNAWENNELSTSAFTKHENNLRRDINNLLNLQQNYLNGVDNIIKELDNDGKLDNILAHYNAFIGNYNEEVKTTNNIEKPTATIQDLIKQKADTILRKSYNDSNIPQNNKEYQEIYEEFSMSLDEVTKNRINDYIDKVKDYLRNAEDFEYSLSLLLNGTTEDRKLNEAIEYLKYGYISEEGQIGQDKETDFAYKNINTQLNLIINSLRAERNKADERNNEAKEQNVDIPSNKDLEEAKDVKEEKKGIDSPSTGNERKSDLENVVVRGNTETNIKDKDTSPVEGMFDASDSKPAVDTTIPVDTSDDTKMTDKELQENAIIAETNVTESNKASIDADTYIKKVAFTQINKIEDITKALANGDNSKKEEFINEVVNFLIDKGYNENLSKKIANDSFIRIATSFALMDSKNAFGKLVQQLALGMNEETANKYSVTELIEGKGIDEIVDKFLDEYSKLVELSKTEDGVVIINIESLFDYLLNNTNVDVNTASYVYNHINDFISTNNGSKYKFTGFDITRNRLTAEDFFNRLKENKANIIASREKMHISPIERDKRTEDYNKAIEAIARGAKTFLVEERDQYGEVTDLAVYVPITKGKTTTNVKIGILRAVETNEDLSSFSPVSHYSGFANKINIENNKITLDCDVLFEDLINNHDTDANTRKLFNDILKYTIIVQDIIDRLNTGAITDKAAAKELSESMSPEMAKSILNNPKIKHILDTGIYRIYNEYSKDEIAQAKTIANSISAILFYGHHFDVSDPYNNAINTISVDKKTMRERYEDWKIKVHFNYTHTYELQKSFNEDNKEVFINTNVQSYTVLNTIKNPREYVNIDDAGFDIDPTSPTYTPLLMVSPDGYFIDENGEKKGLAPLSIQPYSMGFLVHNENDINLVGYCNTALELSEGPITKYLKDEIVNIIIRQLNNTNPDNHEETYNNLKDRIIELFEHGSLFKFAQTIKGTNRIKVKTMSDGSAITIAYTDENGNNERNLLSLFLKNKDGITNSNAVGIYIPRLNKQIPIVSIKDTNYGGEIIKEHEIRDALNSTINILFSTVKLNRSLTAMTNKRIQGETPKLFTKENGKFIVHLGNKDLVYESYADFILQNRGFNTNVNGSGKNSFVALYLNNDKITIDTKIKDTTGINQETNTDVSDLLFNNVDEKRKTVNTRDVLLAAKVPERTIDALMVKIDGTPIVTSRIKIDKDYSEDSDINAYYNTSDGNVYITPKGAATMNNNPNNAIRLILHENLHRLFHNKSKLNDKERERILKELREVYEYTLTCLKRDKDNGKISQDFYNNIISVLTKATKSDNEQVRMEEFLMETLTQKALVKYLNDTDYHSEVKIDGIPTKAKSIFQKIMDILLDLLGINSNRIKNNTILAREYMILSKTSNPTDAGMFTKKLDSINKKDTSNKNIINSETLDNTRKKIDNIRSEFESRIKRSPDFKKNHKYLIDGVEVDYSVTQKIHGEKDLGVWGLPSSLIGNTADEAARQYFNNGDKISGNIPNTTKDDGDNSIKNIEKDLHKIREYLDKRFGKGRYGVITEEFSIGGTVIVNGEEKTIAGTMDMIVYTDTGDIYIFDFKTKRLDKEGNANIAPNTLLEYSQQLNIYRQLIEANYPELKGKVHTGGLIKFAVDYESPTRVEYREDPNVEGQLQVRETKDDEFLNVQDTYLEYYAPFFFGDEDFEKEHIINVETKDYSEEIKALPKVKETIANDEKTDIDLPGTELIQDELDELKELFNNDFDFGDNIDELDDDILLSATEYIEEYNFTEEEQEILRKAPRNAKGKLLVYPNGPISNLNEKQYAQVRTKAFKRWFGDWINPYNKNVNIELDIDMESPDADGFGSMVAIKYNGEYIGTIPMQQQIKSTKDFKFTEYININSVAGASYIEEEFRGKGLGKAAYWELGMWLSKNGSILRSAKDNSRTEAATRVWKSLERDSFAKKVDGRYEFVNNASKVIDENGEPLVVYHGTNSEWNTVDPSKYGTNTDSGYYGKGLYSSSQEHKAKEYGTPMPLFINIKNPLRTGADPLIKSIDEAINNVNLAEEFNRENAPQELNKYDGVLYSGQYIYEEIVTANLNQIKSATENNGDFSLTDNNIYHASTELITDTEIYATPIANGNSDNSFGIKIVNDINEFIDSFPTQYRDSIKQILAENELNYTCQ